MNHAFGSPPSGPWDRVAPDVLPLLRRAHHPYPPDLAPLQVNVPPGVWTGFGVDLGPAMSHITRAQAESWRIGEATLLTTALDNLRGLAGREIPRVERFDLDGVEIVAVQGQGWGSALILTPDVLEPILGRAPRTLLAPVRNTLIALPSPTTLTLAVRLWDAVADGGADELDVPPLHWTGRSIVAVGDDGRGRPN